MRIQELLENNNFSLSEKDESDLEFDLVEDMTFFMQHDDDAYRRNVYPSVVRCIKRIKSGSPVSSSIFEDAAVECYKEYLKKYPIRQLPTELDEELTTNICEKFYQELCKNVEEGKYE